MALIEAVLNFDGGNENGHAIWNLSLSCSNLSSGREGRKAGPLLLVLAQPIPYEVEVFNWWFSRDKVNATITMKDVEGDDPDKERKIELEEAMCTSYNEFYNTGQNENSLMLNVVIEAKSISIGSTQVSNV